MTEATLKIRAYEEPDRCVLELEGELDLAGVPAFGAAARALCEHGARELFIDIARVGFIDSNGLRAILAVKDLCAEHDCVMTMTHGGEQTDALFELTRLIDRLPFRRSRRAAGWRREIELG